MRGLVGTLGGGLEPGHRRDVPAKQPPKLLLGLTPQVADVPEHLGVPLLLFGDALAKAARLRPIRASPPFQARQGSGATFVAGANDNLLRPLIRYSRSAGQRRRRAHRVVKLEPDS